MTEESADGDGMDLGVEIRVIALPNRVDVEPREQLRRGIAQPQGRCPQVERKASEGSC